VNKKDDDHDKHETSQCRENPVKKTTERFRGYFAFLQGDFLCLGLTIDLHGFAKAREQKVIIIPTYK